MVDRIREILSARLLSPTQFADTIGVARPIVSHILSGRNKPSLEVVQKIVAAFPELSLPWLLSGVGSMEAEVAPAPASSTARRLAPKTPETPHPAPSKVVPSSVGVMAAAKPTEVRSNAIEPSARIPTGSEETTDAFPPVSGSLVAPRPVPAAKESEKTVENVPPATSTSQLVGSPMADKPVPRPVEPATTPALGVAQSVAEPNKAIRRIVIFYQDGTFSDYQPEKN